MKTLKNIWLTIALIWCLWGLFSPFFVHDVNVFMPIWIITAGVWIGITCLFLIWEK